MSSQQCLPPLKILMIAPQPFFRARGTPFSVLHRIRALCTLGCSVDLLTYPFGEEIELEGLRIIRSRHVPLVRDIKIGPSVAKLLLDVPLYFKARALLAGQDYDIIHSHEEAAFFCAPLARKYGLPHVYDMHSSLPQQLGNFESFDYRFIRRVFQKFESNVLTSCSGVITICPELAEIAEPICGDTPHSMIENIADDNKVFRGTSRRIREQLNLGNKKLVVYTGTLEAYQGIDILMSAIEKIVAKSLDVHFLLVGGTGQQIAEHRSWLAARQLESKVTLIETVHPSAIPEILEIADILVSPRCSGTNTPLKIYGYLRAGRAVVATNLLTHTQTLNDEIAYLVPPSSEGVAGGIEKLLRDDELRGRLADAASAHAEQYFSDDSYIQKVYDLYLRVTQNSGLDELSDDVVSRVAIR